MAKFGQNDKKVKRFGEDDPVEVVGEALADSAESLGRRGLDAFTIGYGDEIIAGIQSAMTDTPYDEALAASEARTQEFQRQAQEQSVLPFNLDPVEIAGLATGGGALSTTSPSRGIGIWGICARRVG